MGYLCSFAPPDIIGRHLQASSLLAYVPTEHLQCSLRGFCTPLDRWGHVFHRYVHQQVAAVCT